MTRPRVYLAGPITGLDYRGATDWRDSVRNILDENGIEGVNPMRGKSYLAALPVIEDAVLQQACTEGIGREMSSAKGITYRDRNDVLKCDVVLMNLLGAKRVSIGTMIEAGWADAFRKPVVLAREPENVHAHGMLDTIAAYITPSLDEAITLVRYLIG